MKKKYSIVFLILIAISLSSCAQQETNSDKLQKKTFDILIKMDSLAYNEFYKEYIDLEDYKQLAKKNDLEESYRNEILELNESSFHYFRRREYNNLKENGTNHSFVWSDIKFVDFKYQIKDEQGFNWLDGSMFFSYKESIYEARVYSIFDGKEYQIFGIKM